MIVDQYFSVLRQDQVVYHQKEKEKEKKNAKKILIQSLKIRIDNEKSKSQIMKLHLIFFFVGNVSKFLSQKASVTLSCHIYHVQ